MNRSEIAEICVHEHLLIDMTHEAVEPTTPEALEIYHSHVGPQNIELLRKNPYVVHENLKLDDTHVALQELSHIKQAGVNLLIDATTVGLGRDIPSLLAISKKTDVQIAVGCGLFVHDSLPEKYANWSTGQIYEWMMDEIQNGIDGSGAKPGIIGEIGTSEKIYPIEEKSLLAAAKAHVASGLPVMLHTYPWTDAGLQAAKLLIESGVAPNKLCVCHVDVTFSIKLLAKLLALGVFIEFDNFGKEFEFEAQAGAFAGGPFETDAARVQMLAHLCGEGFAPQILLSSDVCTKSLLRAYGGRGYDHVFTNIVPMMRKAGLDEKTISMLRRENAMRYLFDD